MAITEADDAAEVARYAATIADLSGLDLFADDTGSDTGFDTGFETFGYPTTWR